MSLVRYYLGFLALFCLGYCLVMTPYANGLKQAVQELEQLSYTNPTNNRLWFYRGGWTSTILPIWLQFVNIIPIPPGSAYFPVDRVATDFRRLGMKFDDSILQAAQYGSAAIIVAEVPLLLWVIAIVFKKLIGKKKTS